MTVPTLGGAGLMTPTPAAAPAATPTVDPANPVIAVITEPSAAPTNTPIPTPTTPPSTPAGTDPASVEPAAIERARQQEREKLYGRLGTMETELAALRAERQTRLDAEAEATRQREEADRQRQIAETSAKDLLTAAQDEWKAKFDALEEERKLERAALAKDAEAAQLRAYIQEQVRLNSENIMPQLVDFITGNTREEVDASITAMTAKSNEIFEAATKAQTAQRSQMRGVSPTAIPGTGLGETGTRSLTVSDIENMPMSRWAELRGQIINSDSTKNRGLFG